VWEPHYNKSAPEHIKSKKEKKKEAMLFIGCSYFFSAM